MYGIILLCFVVLIYFAYIVLFCYACCIVWYAHGILILFCQALWYYFECLWYFFRYNRLLGTIHQSLQDLLKALKGLVVMSQELENMANSLYNNTVPAMWAGKVILLLFVLYVVK